MDADQLARYLREGKNDDMPEPSGDGGFIVPQPYADRIHIASQCQSSWLRFFQRVSRWITGLAPRFGSTVSYEWDDDDPFLKKLHALFVVVTEFVYESGGDGDGWIISENYEELADEFAKWQVGKGWKGKDIFLDRHRGDGFVTFEDNQESVSFVRDRSHLASWAGDIIIESSHFEFIE